MAVAGLGYALFRERPQLDASLTVPAEVASGATLDLVVAIANPHTQDVSLDSIDIDDALLEGFQVLGVEPAASDTDHISFLNQRTWTFERPVAPEARMTVTFHLRALAAGRHAGNVDVCNRAQDCRGLHADIVVR